MHILLIHQAFAALNEPGGTRHHELARHLVSRGHRVTIIASPVSYLTGRRGTRSQPELNQEEAGITLLRAYTYTALHRSFVHRVFSFISFMVSAFLTGLRVRNVDLVWGTSPPIFQAGAAWALARVKRVPFLFEVRDLWPAFAVAVGVLRQPGLIRAAEGFERFLYRQADCVLVNSPGFIDHVRRRGARHIELVPNGADVTMFEANADGEDFRRAHGLGSRFVAMYAGAHGLSNDLGVLLDAAALLRSREDIVWVLLGDGKEKQALEMQAAALGLDNVLFLPPIPKTEMPAALAAADACIAILLPLLMYKTVYPKKVFDYMAAGRPVVLAIDGVIREVVEAASAGVFTPPGSPAELARAVDQLAGDQESARAMGRNGRQYLKGHFDRQRLAEKLADILEQLVAADIM